MQIDDDVIPVSEGSAVRVASAGERCLRNTSASEPLVYVCVQAKTGSLEQWTYTDGVPSTRTAEWATG
jgi:mannose-6-phosphate isomerase-like protein (cupin superfamily)